MNMYYSTTSYVQEHTGGGEIKVEYDGSFEADNIKPSAKIEKIMVNGEGVMVNG